MNSSLTTVLVLFSPYQIMIMDLREFGLLTVTITCTGRSGSHSDTALVSMRELIS